MVKNRPRIGIIGAKGLPAYGGAASSIEKIIGKLKDKYEFTVYAIDTHANDANYNDVKQIIFKGNRNDKYNTLIYYIKSMFHSVFYEKYDLIYINHLASGFILPVLKIKYKVIGTDRGSAYLNFPGKQNKWSKFEIFFLSLFKKMFLRFCDIVVTVSRSEVWHYKKTIANNKLFYIPNGVDLQEVAEINKKSNKNKVDYNDYILFSANRIINLKGAHLLLEALSGIQYNGQVLIIGDLSHSDEYKEYLYSLVKKLNVVFIGLIKDKSLLFDYIMKAKFFVFPSYTEGMSNMLLEVVSCETPVIASDISENTEIFSEDEILFFKSGSVSDLRNKIDYALKNKSVMAELSEKAKERLLNDYNMDIVANKYDELFSSLILANKECKAQK